jgi:alpha-tubulin suppressor-like RCC1 family protein
MRWVSVLAISLTACGGHSAAPPDATHGDDVPDATVPDATVPDGAPADSSPDAAPAITTVALDVGYGSACALRSDASLWCWGMNPTGSLGPPGVAIATPTQRPGTWLAASLGSSGCAIDGDGKLLCTHLGTTQQIGVAADWSAVSAGNGHSCGLRGTPGTATAWCWTDTTPTPRQVGTSADWTAVSAGQTQSCGIHAGNTLDCWTDPSAPAPVAGSGWTDVSVGRAHVCAIASGEVYCWTSGSPALVEHPGTAAWTRVFADDHDDADCAVQADDTLWCWGMNAASTIITAPYGYVPVPQQQGSGESWRSAAISLRRGYALRVDGTVVVWGIDASVNHLLPTQIPGTWLSVRGRLMATCAIRGDHTLWCWGAAGDIASDNSTEPLQVGTDTDWASIEISREHQCGLKTDGALYCWSANGQPERFGTATWDSVVVGIYFTCALDDGAVWCWGQNHSGELGRGTAGEPGMLAPAPIASSEYFVALFARESTVCALTDGDDLYCWGWDYFGQVGRGSTTTTPPEGVPTPTLVQSGIRTVLAGPIDMCAARVTGGLVCWGNTYGVTPVVIDDADVTSLGGGPPYTCAIEAGRPSCGGTNEWGIFGNGTIDPNGAIVIAPVDVTTARSDWTYVETSAFVSCGLAGAGELYCWGGVFVPGTIGDGQPWSHTPVEVHFD